MHMTIMARSRPRIIFCLLGMLLKKATWYLGKGYKDITLPVSCTALACNTASFKYGKKYPAYQILNGTRPWSENTNSWIMRG